MKIQQLFMNIIRVIFLIFGVIEIFHLNSAKIFALIAGLLVCFIPELYTKCFKVKIPISATFIYTLFVFAAQFLGTYLRAYEVFPWWDVMLHLVSGVLVGYVGLVLLITLDRSYLLFKQKRVVLIAFFIFTVAVTGAVFWEIIEFTGDTLFGMNAQLGSLRDTMEDLICGTIVGGGFAVYIGWVLHKGCSSCVTQLLQLNKQGARHK